MLQICWFTVVLQFPHNFWTWNSFQCHKSVSTQISLKSIILKGHDWELVATTCYYACPSWHLHKNCGLYEIDIKNPIFWTMTWTYANIFCIASICKKELTILNNSPKNSSLEKIPCGNQYNCCTVCKPKTCSEECL